MLYEPWRSGAVIIKKESVIMIREIIKTHYAEFTEAIYHHTKKYELNPRRYELRLYVDETGTPSLKSEEGYTQGIWNGAYYVFAYAGGDKTQWDIIGSARERLENDDVRCILDDIPEDQRNDEPYVQRFLEENYPELVSEWLEDSYINNYDSAIENIEDYLENFLEMVEEVEEGV